MKHITIGLVMLAFAATFADAQTGTSELRGRVIDAQQAAMPGVTVIARNQESGLFRETTSGPDGSFFLGAMLPGVYQIDASLQGFRPFQRRDVRLIVGQATNVDVPLQVGGIEESLTVRAEAPLVDTTSTEIGGNINTEEFSETPSFGRNFTGFLGMLPGVVANTSTSTFGSDNINAGGQHVRNINYSLDGSDNNDPVSGGNQGSQVRVPLEAVQEFTLLTGQFDAEFGQASGGVVNAVTKQGTNLYHGSAFAFFQNDKLSSRNYFVRTRNLTEAPVKQEQWGGTFGGPIVKDKAHYFLSLERIVYDQGYTNIVPGRADLNGVDFAQSRIWNTFIRVDHQINANNTWGLRWLRDASPQPRKLNTSIIWTHTGAGAELDLDQTWVGTLNSVLGATKVNTLRVIHTNEGLLCGNPNFIASYQDGGKSKADQKGQLPTLNYPAFIDQQSSTAYFWDQPASGFENTFSWFIPNKAGGDHELKFGGNYRRAHFTRNDYSNLNGTFTFNNNVAFNPADPRTYPERFSIRVPGVQDFGIVGHTIGGFAQDKWKVGDRLTMNLGFRYDLEILKTPNKDNPLFTGNPDGYPIDRNNIQPRIGFSYALDGQGRSSIRGGFGLFINATAYLFLTPMISDGRFVTGYIAQFPTDNIDPGPRNGQLPTNPFLVNGPTVNHNLVDAQFPANGALLRNLATVRFDTPDRQVPYSRQYSVGYQTQVGSSIGVTVDVIRSESRDQYMLKDLNPAVRSSTLATGIVTRTNPIVGTVGEFASRVDALVNEGWIDYTSLQLGVNKRLSQGFSARLSYAYSVGRGNNATGQADVINSQYLNDLRLDTEVGPTAADRPHILSLSGAWDVPHTGGLKLSGVMQARSGLPFSLVNTTFDADRNGITTGTGTTPGNEYLPAGTYSGTGTDAVTVDYKGGRNGARAPSYVVADVRGGYRIKLGASRTLDLHVDVFNITNRANFVAPAGDQRLATFLRLADITGATRTAQLNARFGF